jgi:ADP-heptose:LPS heptosyltransferase
MPADRGEIRSVVIPAAAGVGNAIMAMPLVRQLHRGLKQPRISAICLGRGIGDVFESMREVQDVKVTGPGPRGFLRFVKGARERAADLYLVPYPSNRWQYNVLAALSGCDRAIMHDYPIGRFRALHWLKADRLPAQRGVHDVVQNLRLLTLLGIDPDVTEGPRMEVSFAHAAAADELLLSAGIGLHRPFLVIHPGSGQTVFGDAKRWPVEKFAELSCRLAEATRHSVLVLEGPDEAGLASEVAVLAGHSAVSALKLTVPLQTTAALLRRSRICVGNDGALAHLAAAVGRIAVTVFGPTPADTICPFGQRRWAVTLAKSCAPCFSYPFQTPYPAVRCRPPMCISEIPVQAVFERATEAIDYVASADEPAVHEALSIDSPASGVNALASSMDGEDSA